MSILGHIWPTMRFTVSDSISYVAYISPPPKKNHSPLDYTEREIHSINEFIHKKNGSIVKIFIETGENRRRHTPWPEFKTAIEYAISQNAHLVINEIHHLSAEHSFVELLLKFIDHEPLKPVELYCCDQPYIRKNNFKTIAEYAMQRRKRHSLLIREGLSRSYAKSGNPNAIEMINKINKPKIGNAIVFSLILAPVISAYRLQGLSQRKMVQRLNDEGFCAPEGGKWVLSQFQKILNRIKLNESALSLEHKCQTLKSNGLNNSQIAEEFNVLSIPSPFNGAWTDEQISILIERANLIHEIMELHEFILMLSPILEKYHPDEFNENILFNELQEADIHIPELFHSNINKQL